MTSPNPKLDELIASTLGWKGEIVARLRAAIHAADPEIVETRKWVSAMLPGTPCFEHDGTVCHINVLKERVRLTMTHGAQLPDPNALFNAYPDSATRRGSTGTRATHSTRRPSRPSSVPASPSASRRS